MKHANTILCVALGLGTAIPCVAKEEKVAPGDLPAAVTAAVAKRFPDAKISGAGKEEADGELVYEVQLVRKERKIDVTVRPDGAIREIEEQLPQAELPQPVQRAIAKQYAKSRLRIAEKITLVKDGKESLDAYEVKLDADGKVTEVKLTPDGKILHTEVQTGDGDES